MNNFKHKLRSINTFVFDYDGVLSDGTVILMPDGEALRTANVKDGYALQLAVKKGYNVAIISGGRSASMIKRFEALGIKNHFTGVNNKLNVFRKYLKNNKIQPESVIFTGDDIPDLKPMKEAGLACCPADASPEIKAISHYISPYPGGRGCVRNVIEQTLKLQDKWMNDDAFCW